MSLDTVISSGRIADIILVILAAEAVILGFALRRSAALSSHLAGLAAGACLVLALRAALTGAGWTLVALFLTLSFLAHAIELGILWRRR